MSEQAEIDERNRKFWQEICGTGLARATGTDGADAGSIREFDRRFFAFYPYLDKYVRFGELRGKDVLEVGLGYGSVSERIAASGARFTGLDIARGPVDWVNHRLRLSGLPGRAAQGSALDMPFEDEAFDVVVTIGCLHHTGNLKTALGEVHRVLRPGGRAMIMVYNAVSYLRWIKHPGETLDYVRAAYRGADDPLPLDARMRGRFDRNSAGEEAPETVLASKTTLTRMLGRFRSVSIARTNVADHRLVWHIPRHWRNAVIGPWLGVDLYATAIK